MTANLKQAAQKALTDEQCDKAAAQAMDRIAAAKRMHALDLNPDITVHHTLRRELVRAGYALPTLLHQEAGEPVTWIDPAHIKNGKVNGMVCVSDEPWRGAMPLYTSPPPQPTDAGAQACGAVSALEEDREHVAMMQVMQARMGLSSAIESFEKAGYGSHVTQPLRDALALAEFSIKEVTS